MNKNYEIISSFETNGKEMYVIRMNNGTHIVDRKDLEWIDKSNRKYLLKGA